jgi:hypothetical protein
MIVLQANHSGGVKLKDVFTQLDVVSSQGDEKLDFSVVDVVQSRPNERPLIGVIQVDMN